MHHYLALGILFLGFFFGQLSRSTWGGASAGSYWVMLLFALTSIFFGLPFSFVLAPILAALPLSSRHPLLYQGYWVLLAGALGWFVVDLFGEPVFVELLLYLILLALGWALSLVAYRHYEELYGNPSFSMAASLLLLQQLAQRLEMDLTAEILLIALSIGLIGFALGARPTLRWNAGGLRFFAFVYAGVGLLIARESLDMLKVLLFLAPVWVLLLLKPYEPLALLQPQASLSRSLLLPLMQFWIGIIILQVEATWILLLIVGMLTCLILWLNEKRARS